MRPCLALALALALASGLDDDYILKEKIRTLMARQTPGGFISLGQLQQVTCLHQLLSWLVGNLLKRTIWPIYSTHCTLCSSGRRPS